MAPFSCPVAGKDENAMDADVGRLRDDVLGQLASAGDLRALDEVRVAAIGKKGRVTELTKTLGSLPPERRREAGLVFNQLKREVETAIEGRARELEAQALDARLAAERI